MSINSMTQTLQTSSWKNNIINIVMEKNKIRNIMITNKKIIRNTLIKNHSITINIMYQEKKNITMNTMIRCNKIIIHIMTNKITNTNIKKQRKCWFILFLIFTRWFWCTSRIIMQCHFVLIRVKSRVAPAVLHLVKIVFHFLSYIFEFSLFLTSDYFHHLYDIFSQLSYKNQAKQDHGKYQMLQLEKQISP